MNRKIFCIVIIVFLSIFFVKVYDSKSDDYETSDMFKEGNGELFVLSPKKVELPIITETFADGSSKKYISHTSIHFYIAHPPEIYLVSYETPPIVEEAITDSNEDISAYDYNPILTAMSKNDKQGFGLTDKRSEMFISRNPPAKEFKALKSIKGSFNIKYALNIEEIRLDEIRDQIGIENKFKDLLFEVEELTEGTITIRYNKDAYDYLKDIKFLAKDHKIIGTSGSLGSKQEDGMLVKYKVSFPEDGAIVFSFYDELRKCTVPFDFTNIKVSKNSDRKK